MRLTLAFVNMMLTNPTKSWTKTVLNKDSNVFVWSRLQGNFSLLLKRQRNIADILLRRGLDQPWTFQQCKHQEYPVTELEHALDSSSICTWSCLEVPGPLHCTMVDATAWASVERLSSLHPTRLERWLGGLSTETQKASTKVENLRVLALQDPIGKCIVKLLTQKALRLCLPMICHHPQFAYLPFRSTRDALMRVANHCYKIWAASQGAGQKHSYRQTRSTERGLQWWCSNLSWHASCFLTNSPGSWSLWHCSVQDSTTLFFLYLCTGTRIHTITCTPIRPTGKFMFHEVWDKGVALHLSYGLVWYHCCWKILQIPFPVNGFKNALSFLLMIFTWPVCFALNQSCNRRWSILASSCRN